MYCSECGSKNGVGAKFCSSCGNPLVSLIQKNQPKKLVPTPSRADVDDDGLPTSVVKPKRLEYEIEKSEKNKFSVKDIVNSPPSSERFSRPVGKIEKLTKEQYLSQSLKECASSKNFNEINEA